MVMPDVLLLPSARLIEADLQADFGPIPPVLIPLDGEPAFRRIANAISPLRTIVAGHQSVELIREHLAFDPDPNVVLVDVGATRSLGETIVNALKNIDFDEHDRLVVNFADTLVADLPIHGDIICFRRVTHAERWTSFSTRDGVITAIVEKGFDKTETESNVFVGVFAIRNPRLFATLLDDEMAIDSEIDPFYRALSAYSVTHNFMTHEPSTWHDFGHLDTYYDTRQRFYVNRRAFNRIEIDTNRGLLYKTSDDQEKLANEIAWYLELPTALAPFAPRVFDFSLQPGTTYANLEFYGYSPLAESYLHGAWSTSIWMQAFAAIGQTIDAMSKHTAMEEQTHRSVRRNHLHNMYVEKTLARFAQMSIDNRFDAETIRINGDTCVGLATVRQTLVALVEASGLLDIDNLSVMHGDLCLSNILFDRRTSIVRLIDPRGSFGAGRSIYGDPRYDLAKLSHSINGNYDHMLQGLFDVAMTDDGVSLSTRISSRQQQIKSLFDTWLRQQAGENYNQVRLIESLLFLSMVPLHADRPESQIAFLSQGLLGYTEAMRYWLPNHKAVSASPTSVA
jgi:hypothetical protein